MAYHSQSQSQYPNRPLPAHKHNPNHRNGHYHQHQRKRPLTRPPDKAVPPTPKFIKKKPPINFASKSVDSYSKSTTSLPRKYSKPPSHSRALPSMKKSASANLECKHIPIPIPIPMVYDDAHFIEAADDDDYDADKKGNIHWVRGELIGIGAFAKVYKGYDKNTGKICAIKQIPFYFYPNTAAAHKKQVKEAHIMRQLQHDNIVQIYGYQRSIKYRTLCILMELVNGISIYEYYNKYGCFSEKLIRKYSRMILCGLEFAHKRNIIHRDIKGKNILISNGGTIKLADFGSAKLSSDTEQSDKFQASMDYQYTPLWTAPEVLHNGGYDNKIDIWSVGCVVIEMCTAKQPWNECNFENVWSALYYIGQPDNYPSYPSSLSKLCKDFIKLCLIRDASKRCSASELLRHKFLD